ncbi:hypothetical protein CAC42_6357 [Sphaceloma murrayae]|uniref:Uncharacterized protein n=1 Tax=Sphaceloma murrayae TaxID=2082308 RepID=A0A2K1QN10_9PEZI|nr:hypothetical protein CAC42_6357 [Sphaceloma murrayae]
MSASVARGAFTCARCRFRQSLRQDLLALSQSKPSINSRRFASSEANLDGRSVFLDHEKSERSYKWRVLSPNGKIIGRRGRRQRQKTEPLKIKSLDQDSEVIVLRDVPEEPEDSTEEQVLPAEDDVDESPASSDRESGDLLVEGLTPKDTELFAGIEEHRPKETVLSKKKFREAQRAVTAAHTAPQLRKYIKRFEALEATRRREGAENETKSVDVSGHTSASKKGDVEKVLDNRTILVTPWFRTHSAPTVALSPDLKEKEEKVAKKLHKTSEILDRLFRKVWKVQVLEDRDASGELEVILQPRQWRLLQTRAATRLFTTLRKGVFYQRVRLDHDIKRGALRVYGPQRQAESLTDLIRQAFQSSCHFSFRLEMLAKVFPHIRQIIPSALGIRQLRQLELATGAVIYHDATSNAIRISAFDQKALREARRLVTAILDLRPKGKVERLGSAGAKTSDIPYHASSSLPLSTRAQEWIRRVRPSTTREGVATDDSKITGRLRSSSEKPSRLRKGDEQALCRVLQRGSNTPLTKLKGQLWSVPKEQATWLASFGSLLTKPSKKSQPTDSKTADVHFHRSMPRLATILSWFRSLPSTQDQDAGALANQLVVKLSPTVQLGSQITNVLHFPTLEIVFNIIQAGATGNPTIALTSVNATLNQNTCLVDLPDQSVDLEFSRSTDAIADTGKLLEDQAFKSYVESVVRSMEHDKELQAPSSLNVVVPKIPQSPMTSAGGSRKKSKANGSSSSTGTVAETLDENELAYSFMGFEFRFHRRIEPDIECMPPHLVEETDSWSVTDVEGGLVGGKRNEVVLEQGPGSQDLQGFVKRAFSMAEFITAAHRGEIKPLKQRMRTPAGETLDKAESQQEDHDTSDSLPSHGPLVDPFQKNGASEELPIGEQREKMREKVDREKGKGETGGRALEAVTVSVEED